MSQEVEAVRKEIEDLAKRYTTELKNLEVKLMCAKLKDLLQDPKIVKKIKSRYRIVGDIGYRKKRTAEQGFFADGHTFTKSGTCWEDTDTCNDAFANLPYDIDVNFDCEDDDLPSFSISTTRSMAIFKLLKEMGDFEVTGKEKDKFLSELTMQKMTGKYDVKLFN